MKTGFVKFQQTQGSKRHKDYCWFRGWTWTVACVIY